MKKPATAPTPQPPPTPKYEGPPVKRIRAIQKGSNDYTLIEETFAGPPVVSQDYDIFCALIGAQRRPIQ